MSKFDTKALRETFYLAPDIEALCDAYDEAQVEIDRLLGQQSRLLEDKDDLCAKEIALRDKLKVAENALIKTHNLIGDHCGDIPGEFSTPAATIIRDAIKFIRGLS